MATEYQRLLKRWGISRLELPGAAFEKFRERTAGLLEARWHGSSPERIAQVIELYGLDCYLQGLLDGAQTCVMRPELVTELRAMEAAAGETSEGAR
jgi:hypothetical protein